MRRALVVVTVILAALGAAATSAGATQPRHGLQFELHAGGFWIQAQSQVGSGRMRLLLDRHGEVAYYYVPVRIGAGSVRARFGRLGSLDFRFVPDRGEGTAGCGGSEGLQRGTFVGSLVFHGEHDYAHVDAGRAPGWFETEAAGSCGRDRRRDEALFTAAPRPGEVAETGAELEGWVGSRQAGRLFYFFTVNGPDGAQVSFNAFRYDRREGMLIERGAQVYGGARSFAWDLGRGTARVDPPAPFSGRAVYRRGADARRPSWTGSLSVPILGAKPMRLTGAAFQAHLGRGT